MKPFNLEEALAGKAVRLRNGKKASARMAMMGFTTSPPADSPRRVRIKPAITAGFFIVYCSNKKVYTS